MLFAVITDRSLEFSICNILLLNSNCQLMACLQQYSVWYLFSYYECYLTLTEFFLLEDFLCFISLLYFGSWICRNSLHQRLVIAPFIFEYLKCSQGTSLVAQWLRIRLPVQGTWVRALVQEDPTCRGATKLVCHNYWARMPQLLQPTCLEPVLRNKEKPPLAATRESLHTATKTQRSQKINKVIN